MRNNAIVQIGRGPHAARFGPQLALALIAGPCQLESRAHALEMAQALKEIAGRRAIGLVFKSSFDKANRTSGSAKRGIGLEAALPIFAEIRDTLGLDYAGVDFATAPNGDLLLFEANATMVIAVPDSDPRWAYRRDAIGRSRRRSRQIVDFRCIGQQKKCV